MPLTDKDLHCIARQLQPGAVDKDGSMIGCLYCKYAFDCAAHSEPYQLYMATDLLQHLQEETGVCLTEKKLSRARNHLISGSWIETDPELMAEFKNLSFEERQDRLKSPDILRYARSRRM